MDLSVSVVRGLKSALRAGDENWPATDRAIGRPSAPNLCHCFQLGISSRRSLTPKGGFLCKVPPSNIVKCEGGF
jgi:hypothetical protein